jgi:hypothetical protein
MLTPLLLLEATALEAEETCSATCELRAAVDGADLGLALVAGVDDAEEDDVDAVMRGLVRRGVAREPPDTSVDIFRLVSSCARSSSKSSVSG